MPQQLPIVAAVKDACAVGLWSQGVKLVREGAVSGEKRSASELTFRVKASGRAVAPTVTLYLDDEEWDCNCGGKMDPCAHVAAAAIGLGQDGEDAYFGGDKKAAVIRYDLVRRAGGLSVDRVVIASDGTIYPIKGVLSDLIARRSPELELWGLSPTQEDLKIDLWIGRHAQRALPLEKGKQLLEALGDATVTLDGEPVETSAEPISPHAIIINGPRDGVSLQVTKPADVEVVVFGIVRRANQLHPLGAGELFGSNWENLPMKRDYPAAALGEFAATTLAEMLKQLEIKIQTSRLPKTGGILSPWIRFEVERGETGMDVMPTLVYGDPPLARIDSGRIVHLSGSVPRRKETEEKDLVLRLRDQLNMVVGRRVKLGPPEAAKFVSQLRTFNDGRGAQDRPLLAKGVLLADLHVHGEAAELSFVLRSEAGAEGTERRATAEAVIAAWRDGLDVVPLTDGGFAPLPEAFLSQHGHAVADLLAARDDEHRVRRSAIPVLAELCEALDQATPPDLTKLVALVEGTKPTDGAPPAVTLPDDFGGELRPYQRDGVAFLSRLCEAELGAVLADDMGLGKTVQTLCAIKGKTLVVAPRSVIHNWVAELTKFRPNLTVAMYHGAKREVADTDVLITTYGTMRNDIDTLAEVAFDTIVLDEAQAIKNPDSQVARAAFRLKAPFRVSLTGTPIENRLEELWSQMHFANPGLLGARSDFADRYQRPIDAGDPEPLIRLRKRIAPFLLRRLKKNVATDLPPRTEAVLYCELEPHERTQYDTVRAAAQKELVEQLGGNHNPLRALEALLRLRQAACHTGLLPGHTAETSAKVEVLQGALESLVAEGHKALVFSQWTSMLDLIEPHLREGQLPFLRLDGSTRDRGGVVEAFQRDDGPPILLISLTAGGTGLNLTAADHVFLMDPWWNPAVEAQAADRAHRIGQDKPVMVYRLVAKDTVEERVLDLAERKRVLAGAALADAEARAGASVTREDIIALLE